MKAKQEQREAQQKRCAIYTRKSTTMGLEKEFNTLDHQRSACEAYILSQAGAGWTTMEQRYDDGGFTGANIDRPAFQRLLADVEAGEVDAIVVYKLDRISRSLLDFATVMQRLNKAGVSFVSVTQNFSTTDAVGRMTLNLLATFAEFEREQIGERTRDKMAAARRRGKWTGGTVPLGYRVVDKKLVVDELEAVLVREVFATYLAQRSALATAQVLNENGHRTKRHVAANGRVREARLWVKGDVLRILRNHVYAGFMSCGDQLHDGEQDAIVDRETFNDAKALLATAGGGRGRRFRNPNYVLAGLLYCACCGSALTPSSCRKKAREYRYYRCTKKDRQGRKACPARPMSGPAIEEYVVDQLSKTIAESDLADALVASVRARIEVRRADLAVERRRLPTEIGSLSAEGKRLVEKVGKVEGPAKRLLDERLDEVGAQLLRYESRLAQVEREIEALDATEVEAGWIAQCLRDFEDVWDVLTPENRGRLLRAVIERVEVDEPAEEIRTKLADLSCPEPEAMSA